MLRQMRSWDHFLSLFFWRLPVAHSLFIRSISVAVASLPLCFYRRLLHLYCHLSTFENVTPPLSHFFSTSSSRLRYCMAVSPFQRSLGSVVCLRGKKTGRQKRIRNSSDVVGFPYETHFSYGWLITVLPSVSADVAHTGPSWGLSTSKHTCILLCCLVSFSTLTQALCIFSI